jgi:cellulose synthase/poly-beta-1,6-N-acetylglucosamine synthase-like glycosyltransferase
MTELPDIGTVPGSPSVSVVVTVLDDPRVELTLESLLAQTLPPEQIIVDDGGRGEVVRRIAERFHARDPRVVYLLAPGNVAESRNHAIQVATGVIVAFLDADEVAPPEWLERLTRPFAEAKVGFTGGPTPAMNGTARTVGAQFYDGYLQRFYDRVARAHPHSLPMGNSAWRASLFRELGPLVTFEGRRIGGEDLDFALRCVEAGWRGVYVPDAEVAHDFSDISTASLLRKQRRYAEGGYAVWRDHRSTSEATGGRLALYAWPFGFALIGIVLLVVPVTSHVGLYVLIADALGLGALFLALTVHGRSLEAKYPGLRFEGLEILRRWATMYGAAAAIVHRTRTGHN